MVWMYPIERSFQPVRIGEHADAPSPTAPFTGGKPLRDAIGVGSIAGPVPDVST